MARIVTQYHLPSELIQARATTLAAGDLLTVQKSGERFLRAINATDLPYLQSGASLPYIPIGGGDATGYVGAKAFRCRAGVNGSFANVFNIEWTGSTSKLWIDGTDVGALLRSGSGSIVSSDMARGAASVSVMAESSGAVTLSSNNVWSSAVVSQALTISEICDLLLLYEADWESGRSQGVQTYYVRGRSGYTQSGADTVLREWTVHRRDGTSAQVTAAGGTSYPVSFSNERHYGTTMHAELWTNLTPATRTYWAKFLRWHDTSSTPDYGSAKINSARIIAVQLRR